MHRQILHLNVVGFQVAVACALEPRLAGAPVAVATAGKARRVVLDVSQQARLAGLRRGMLLDVARRRCPDMRIVDPQPGAGERAQAALVAAAGRLAPGVEPAGPGHVFVDLTGTGRLLGSAVDAAARLRREIARQCGLDAAVGVAANKLVSKVATRVVKPSGLCGVVEGCEENFLAPLPVYLLPGIEAELIRRLLQFNLDTVGDLHGFAPQRLALAIGPAAFEIDRLCRGIDPSPVRPAGAPRPVVCEETVLAEQTNDRAQVRAALLRLLVAAGMRLRSLGLAAHGLALTLTYSDGLQSRRSVNLALPVNGDLSLFAQGERLLTDAYERRVRVSGLGVSLTRLSAPYGQLDLFADTQREENLMAALDAIRGRYKGETIMSYGKMRVGGRGAAGRRRGAR
jgi:DNA polymerase-4